MSSLKTKQLTPGDTEVYEPVGGTVSGGGGAVPVIKRVPLQTTTFRGTLKNTRPRGRAGCGTLYPGRGLFVGFWVPRIAQNPLNP